MPTVTHAALTLLRDLAEAAARGHNQVTVARSLAETLEQLAPVRRFELARVAKSRADVTIIEPADGDWLVDQSSQTLSRSVLRAATSGRRAFVASNLGSEPREQRLPLFDAAVAARSHTEHWFAVTFGEPSEIWGYASAYLGDSAEARRLADPAVLGALARILQLAHRNAVLIDRVASISRRAYRENKRLRTRLKQVERNDVVAVSPQMRQVLDQVDLVAEHDTTVLLQGETGTGKELLARRIHARSSRGEGPFLEINCGALPAGLVESELFGHEKGAFTSATARHIGRFERADGGTLLLDEVGELPLPAQVKLLRVLQEGRIERVGGEAPIEVDVRVIAATHRRLETMVEQSTFRADLFYRLNVFPIVIPPLRDRPDDIQALAARLLPSLARQLGRGEKTLSPAALRFICRHDWPGNVRELENRLERALILARADQIEVADLVEPASSAPPPLAANGNVAAIERLDDAIATAIRHALQLCRGHVYGPRGAAARLGLKPSTLQSKMKKLGIRRADYAR